MKPLLIDSEQEVILRQTLIGVSAFLQARAQRRDPAGIISKAYGLQNRKVTNVIHQMDLDPIAPWSRLHESQQTQFIMLLKAFLDAGSGPLRDVIYTQLHAIIQANRAPVEPNKIASRLFGKGKRK